MPAGATPLPPHGRSGWGRSPAQVRVACTTRAPRGIATSALEEL
ncbi:hypothetical protein [Lentzea roselyniae]